MNLARYMVSQNVKTTTNTAYFLVYSSHRTPEAAFKRLDYLRHQRIGKRLYVRDKWLGGRVKRPALGEEVKS
jgi:hypothetical protein